MSLFEDTYRTIEKSSEGIFKDKGSKFIGYAFPIESEEEWKEKLQEIRSLHGKARHFCWAIRLSPDRTVFRVNDDGEPSGSAGKPILNTLLSYDVTQIGVVVVRYFGGTLLGVPGLINAYKMATKEALDAATITEKTVNDIYELKFDYLQMNEVMRIVKDEDIKILNQKFDNQCQIEFEIRQQQIPQVIGKFEKLLDINLKYLRTI